MNHSRRQLPAVKPHKRNKSDETFDFLRPSTTIKPPSKLAKPTPVSSGPPAMAPIKPTQVDASPPTNNILLAGYLAHEYLTKGTLFGQSYNPARSKATPASSAAGSADFGTMKQPSRGFLNKDKGKAVEAELKANPKPSENKSKLEKERYAQVSELLMNGAHIPGIVNPSQLARFLRE